MDDMNERCFAEWYARKEREELGGRTVPTGPWATTHGDMIAELCSENGPYDVDDEGWPLWALERETFFETKARYTAWRRGKTLPPLPVVELPESVVRRAS